jgi:hypothetical protein
MIDHYVPTRYSAIIIVDNAFKKLDVILNNSDKNAAISVWRSMIALEKGLNCLNAAMGYKEDKIPTTTQLLNELKTQSQDCDHDQIPFHKNHTEGQYSTSQKSNLIWSLKSKHKKQGIGNK